MWDFNGEDDATRCGGKGPGSVATLTKALSALYTGEQEEFLRGNPQGGFLYVQSSGLGKSTLFMPIRSIFPQLNNLPCKFIEGAA